MRSQSIQLILKLEPIIQFVRSNDDRRPNFERSKIDRNLTIISIAQKIDRN